jgi:O-antigen/teichoic acid export membrane protein
MSDARLAVSPMEAGYAACAPSARGPSLTPVTSPAPAPSRSRDLFRSTAAAVCCLQALALLGFVGFYLWELTQDAADDVTRAVMSAVLIALFAVGIGALARGWLRGDNWPNTPTVVWNALLLPVGWSLVQADHGLLGALLILVALVAIVAAIRADTTNPGGSSQD